MRTPPRLASALLRLVLSAPAFEAVSGDLDDAYRAGHGRAWYWFHTLRSIGAYLMGTLPTATDTLLAAARLLRRQPLYVAVVCGTLALAVATATASAVVLRRAFIDGLPYPHVDRLVTVLTNLDGSTSPVSAHVFDDLTRAESPFEMLAPLRPVTAALSTAEVTRPVSGMLVTPQYFELAGTPPTLGRVWSAPGELGVIVSWRFFTESLGSDPAAVGRPITLDGTARVVLGVMPPAFHPPYWVTTEVWMPLDLAALATEPRGRRQLTVLARRAADVTPAAMDAFLDTFGQGQRERFPVEQGRQSWIARPLTAEFTASARPALVGVAAGAGLLLLIVCANIGGLSAARALGLQSQTAVRHALGASRRRLFAEQLSESLCLAITGSLVGLALVPTLVGVASRYQRDFLERVAPFAIDSSTLAFGLAAGVVAGLLAALVPARLLGPAQVSTVVRGTRGSAGTRRLTLARQALVVAQVALALMLVVGAGLLVRTVAHLSRQSVGFRTEGMTSVSVAMPGPRFARMTPQIQLEDAIVERLKTVPGVERVTASLGLPAGASMGASLHIEGRSTADGLPEVGYTSVAPDFREAMGLTLEAGRDLTPSDALGMTGAILINQTMARRHFPDGDALGARIYLGPGRPEPGAWMEVVGIVNDVRQNIVTPDTRPTAYGSTRQYSWPRRFFTVYTPERPAALEADLRKAIQSVDPAVSTGAIFHLPEFFSAQQGRHRLVMTVLALFAAVSLVLCASGLYAVVAMSSEMRRREYAIRLALGAPREHVRWQVARHAATLAGLGVLVGLGLAALGVRGVSGLLNGIQPLDAPTFAAASLLLSLLAAAAAWWPAREASRVNPIDTLRSE